MIGFSFPQGYGDCCTKTKRLEVGTVPAVERLLQGSPEERVAGGTRGSRGNGENCLNLKAIKELRIVSQVS